MSIESMTKIGRLLRKVHHFFSSQDVYAPTSTLIDFTKQYNRLRQHLAVRTGDAQGIASSVNHSSAVAPLPAVNHPQAATSSSKQRDRTTDQLASLAKYSSRLATINDPYTMGVGVNRKGPSSYANAKDKSDRATNEQVLDPRTRIILFKMIGRGLIHEVNGCISTGKEVCS
jgi:RIO kinase 1